MQKYIPIQKVNGKFINLNRMFSYDWARVFTVIGARGYGKTFASKRKCVKCFLYDNLKFVILRDTVAACDAVSENNGWKLFNDLFELKPFNKHTYSVENGIIKIDDKHAGEIMPLSVFYKYKGNSYRQIGWVLFDEFIEESVQAYRGNRARQFANMLETIIRDNQNTRVILTGNSLDVGNDILELFDIHIKSGAYGFYLNKEKGVVVYYAPNSEEFEKRKANSVSTKLTKGTFLDESMNKNEFEQGACVIFEKRKPCSLWGIFYNSENECFRLYKEIKEDVYYACKDINPAGYCYMRFVFNPKQAVNGRQLIDNKRRLFLKNLLQNNKIKFESQYIFKVFCSIVNNTTKK